MIFMNMIYVDAYSAYYIILYKLKYERVVSELLNLKY